MMVNGVTENCYNRELQIVLLASLNQMTCDQFRTRLTRVMLTLRQPSPMYSYLDVCTVATHSVPLFWLRYTCEH